MARIKEEDLRLNLIVNGDQTRKQMREIQTEIDKTSKTIKSLEAQRRKLLKTEREDSEQIRKIDRELKTHRSNLDANRKKYNEYQQKIKITGMTMKELQNHARNLSANLRNLRPGTKEFELYNRELRLTRQRMRELKGQTEATGSAMKGLSAAAGWITAIVIAANKLRGAFETISGFEQANVNLSTILGKSVSEIDRLTKSALALGRSTEYTAAQVTSLQIELAKLGFSMTQITGMQEAILHFATAVGAELSEAAAMAGATLRIFDLQAADTEDALATLAVATNKSALNFGYLQTSMSIVGPVAKTFGFSLKDTTALLGALANAGFDASSAATATRNILLNLANTNGKLAKSIGGPVKSFDELMDAFKKLKSQGIDLAKALELTDKRSVSAFNAFLQGADSARELRGALNDVSGDLERIANEKMNTVEGSIKLLKSAWMDFVLSMRNSTGVIKQILDSITSAIKSFQTMLFPNQYVANQAQTYADRLIKNSGAGAEEAALRDLNYAKEELEAERQRLAKLNRNAASATWNWLIGESGASRAYIDHLEEVVKIREGALQIIRTNKAEAAIDAALNTPINVPEPTYTPQNPSGKPSQKAWTPQEDEEYLAKRNAIIAKYNSESEVNQKAYDLELYEAEKASYERRLQLGIDKGEDRAKIEAGLLILTSKYIESVSEKEKKAAELASAAYKTYAGIVENHNEQAKILIASEDERYNAEKAKYEALKGYIKDYDKVMEVLELQHQNNLREIQLNTWAATQKDLEARHKSRLAEINSQNAIELNLETTTSYRKLEITRKIAEDAAQENYAFLQNQINELEKLIESDNPDIQLTDAQLTEYKTKLAELRKQFGVVNGEVEKFRRKKFGEQLKVMLAGTGKGSLFGISQADWNQFFLNLDKGTLSAEDLSNAIEAVGNMATETFKIVESAMNVTTAKEKKAHDDWNNDNEEKKKNLERRLNAGLMTQAQYDAEIEQMETERDEREKKLELDAAKRKKTMSIIEASINTAISVIKTFSQFGWPAGIAPAAIMAGIGAAQIATIAATPVGYEEGGYTDVTRAQDGKRYRAKRDYRRRGFVSSPTILVGEDGLEYVIPADGVNNPSLAPILGMIESARQQGTLKSLNLQAAYPASSIGYAAGGRIATTTTVQPAAQVDVSAILEKMNRILEKMENPVPAIMTMTGPYGFEEVYNKRQKQRSRGKIE